MKVSDLKGAAVVAVAEYPIDAASSSVGHAHQGASAVDLGKNDLRHCLDKTLPGLPCIMNEDARKGVLESLLVSNEDDDDASTTCGETDPEAVLTEEEDSNSDKEPPLPADWKHPQFQWWDGLLDLSKDAQPSQDACAADTLEPPPVPRGPAGTHRMKLNKRSWFPFNACVARSVGKAELDKDKSAQAAMKKEWDRLRAKKVWDECEPREWDDVRREYTKRGRDICLVFAWRRIPSWPRTTPLENSKGVLSSRATGLSTSFTTLRSSKI